MQAGFNFGLLGPLLYRGSGSGGGVPQMRICGRMTIQAAISGYMETTPAIDGTMQTEPAVKGYMEIDSCQ